jgi:hypothetical protein
MKETPKSQCSPHDIVTVGCFECFLHLCLISWVWSTTYCKCIVPSSQPL